MFTKKLLALLFLITISKEVMNHTSLQELESRRYTAASQVEIGAIYHHYRNPKLQYKIIDVGIQEATEKICVIYKALYGSGVVWVRDLDSWLAEVDVAGKKVARFQKAQ